MGFLFFKSKGERLALKLERLLLACEMAAERSDLEAAERYAAQGNEVGNQILLETKWTQDDVAAFLTQRGLAKSITDDAYRIAMEERLLALRMQANSRAQAFRS